MDLLDLSILEADINNFQYGYFATDINDLIVYATTQAAACSSIGVLAPLGAGYSTLLEKLMEMKGLLEKLNKKIPDIKSKIISLD